MKVGCPLDAAAVSPKAARPATCQREMSCRNPTTNNALGVSWRNALDVFHIPLS
jgi:hypothetical protein